MCEGIDVQKIPQIADIHLQKTWVSSHPALGTGSAPQTPGCGLVQFVAPGCDAHNERCAWGEWAPPDNACWEV